MLPCCEKLSRGSTCLRCFISLSCVLTVIASVAAGILLIVAPEEPSLQLGGGAYYALVPGMFLIGLAVCTLLVAVIGFCAVNKDSSSGLLVYGVLLTTIAIATVVCGTTLFIFVYYTPVRVNLNSTIWQEIQDNSTHIHQVQGNPLYSCCGAGSYRDWLHNDTLWNPDNSTELPPSCCTLHPPTVCEKCTSKCTQLHHQGCVDVLMDRLMIVVDASFGVALAGALLQFFTSLLACYGGWLIKRYQRYDIL